MRYFVLLFCVFLGIWFSGCCDCPTQPESREFIVKGTVIGWCPCWDCEYPFPTYGPCEVAEVKFYVGVLLAYPRVEFGRTETENDGTYSFRLGEDYLDKNIHFMVELSDNGWVNYSRYPVKYYTGTITEGVQEYSFIEPEEFP